MMGGMSHHRAAFALLFLAACRAPVDEPGEVAPGAGDGGTATGSSDGSPEGGTSADPPLPGPPAGPAVPWPLHGSGGFGYAVGSGFPGACVPRGMVKLGPDTSGPWGDINFLHEAGYWYGDDTVRGFSHLHLHGAGATDYGVLGVMALPSFGASDTTMAGYASKFAKGSEVAEPGYYALTLDRGGIRAEFTATARAAHHRYGFGTSAKGVLVLDLDHHLSGGKVTDAELTLDADRSRLRGRLRHVGGMSGGWGGYDVFLMDDRKFHGESRPVTCMAYELLVHPCF
jgi:hypothetical protein